MVVTPVLTRFSAAALGLALAGACATSSSPLASHDGAGGATSSGGGGAGHAGVGGGAGSAAAGHAASGGTAVEAGADTGGDVVATPDGPLPDVAPDVFVDPDGPPELRFLDGLVDAPAVRVCLVPWKDGAAAASPKASPSPEVPYGGVASLAPPPGADAAGVFRVVVIGGDVAQLGGASCQDLLASAPPGVRVAPLAVLPPATLTQPRSLLLVATGCLGGVTLADPLAACGMLAVPPKPDAGPDASAQPDLSTAGLVLAELSRVAPPPDRLGLQVMHASATLGTLSVRVLPEGGQPPVTLAAGLGLGAIAPHPPLAVVLDVTFGVIAPQAQIAVSDASGDLFSAGVAEGLASGSIASSELAAGKGFVLVLIGPRPSPSDAATGGNPARVVWLRQPVLAP